MAKNESLQKARDAKNDEFYTQLNDIANELKHYKEHFKGKTVLCNCDDPRVSNFFHYFSYNFEQLGLKKLITTCYKNQERDLFSRNDSEKAIYLEYTGEKNGSRVPTVEEIGIHELKGDGDFRSEECIALLKSADIVVTNPPFSLFREYVAQLIAYDKKFLIIGNQNAITYKEIFALLKSDKLWLGYTKPKLFQIPQNAEGKSVKIIDGKKFQQFGNVCYFTNLDNKKRHEDLILYKTYNSEEYPKYDNFDAINVDKVTDIPLDYDDVMGVPVTFLDKYNPEQFEIIGNEYDLNIEKGRGYINGKRMYSRIFIRRRIPSPTRRGARGEVMEIKQTEITIRELTAGYADNEENGVVAYGGKLDVRPPYQREFVYKEAQRDAVIDSVVQGFPLNVMYWAERSDGTYEVIDGQQRTISICQYVNGDFAHEFSGNKLFFSNLQDDEVKKFLDYKLNIYICSGANSEKLKWFERINIAGEKLTAQELRNAVYSGSWVSDAKKYFSKNGCAAVAIGADFVSGTANRQEILETAIKWIAGNTPIDEYMGLHQNDENASALWAYFQKVIAWAKSTFPVKRAKYTKNIDWGFLYRTFKDVSFDTDKLEAEIKMLILDDDVTKKAGIYPYVLTRDEKYLSLRSFSDSDKLKAYTAQDGICKKCGAHFAIEEMEADHITPWSEGGKTTLDNCQMLCKSCNRRKSNI